jgi:predicted metal-dependent hydrolase
LISYTVKIHPRARHVRLRLDPREGLVVTVPRRFDQRRVPALIAEKREWIESVQARLDRARSGMDAAVAGPRPERVELPALGERWPVEYRVGQRSTLGFSAAGQALAFQLPRQASDTLDDRIAARLRGWLMDRARDALEPMVHQLAREHGFRHGPITIRNQRARWGSCSARGNLSLNARLLFASPQACRYVLIHELAHTEHLDHSSAFWRRVAELDPDFQRHQAELKTVWHRLPDWP